MKKIAVFLAVLLIFILASCAKESASDANNQMSGENPQANISDGDSQALENTTQEEIKILPDLPEMDFGGREFKIITSDYVADTNMPREIGAEQENGDAINDAIYSRNKKIEEQYNISVKEILHNRDTMNEPVKKSVLAADNSYDLICANIKQCGIMAQNGHLLDLAKANYINLSKPWYDQNAASDLSIGNKVFFAVGDLQISNKDGTWVVLFNKKLTRDLGLEDPYNLVGGGKWTMDKFFEFASAANKDINGDGIMTEEDQWGTLGEGFNIFALMNGAGTRLIKKDESDLPYYAGYVSRDIDIFNKGAEYLGDKNRSILAENYTSKYSNVWSDFINPVFATDRILFFFTSLSRVTWHRDYGTDFGILPVPKYEETQENYVNTVSVWMACAFSIPATSGGENLDCGEVVAEALSAESKYTLIPAYYDVQLKTKLTRDDESSEMLDIIFSNRTYSLAHLYDWGGMLTAIQGMITANNSNFVSSMDKIEPKIVTDIEKTIAAFEKTE